MNTARKITPCEGQDISVNTAYSAVCMEDGCELDDGVYDGRHALNFATSDAEFHARKDGHRTTVQRIVITTHCWFTPEAAAVEPPAGNPERAADNIGRLIGDFLR